MTSILCFYHAPCNDGSASAAALQYRLERGNAGRHEIVFCPISHIGDWSDGFIDDYLEEHITPTHEVEDIYIVDFSFSRTKYDELMAYLGTINKTGKQPPRTICIDHHKSALEKIDELQGFCDDTYIRIGPGLSGATLVWEYFNERREEKLETPELLRYVADQDIWEWKLPDSAEVNAALNTLDGMASSMVVELADSLADVEEWRERRRSQGEAILAMTETQVIKSARQTMRLPNDQFDMYVVNSSTFSSELGNHLCLGSERAPQVLAIIFTIQNDWSVRCSVRSLDGAEVNARQFAERFGGGGHDNAAGCRFGSFDEFHTAIDTIHREGWHEAQGVGDR